MTAWVRPSVSTGSSERAASEGLATAGLAIAPEIVSVLVASSRKPTVPIRRPSGSLTGSVRILCFRSRCRADSGSEASPTAITSRDMISAQLIPAFEPEDKFV